MASTSELKREYVRIQEQLQAHTGRRKKLTRFVKARHARQVEILKRLEENGVDVEAFVATEGTVREVH